MAQKVPPRVEVQRDEKYQTILVSGVFGGHRPGFFEAILYRDELVADEALSTAVPSPEKVYLRRTLQCRLVMDPFQAKNFAQWLIHHINEYEKLFGKIPTPEEVKQHSKGEGPSPYL
ncbi:MAG: hypothetical protein H3Z53_06995 [archaeon]|nr:hypothetical protein [archaeon]MCP8314100.1 hypothetical protein [archaeon]